jgi:hypothetical protein
MQAEKLLQRMQLCLQMKQLRKQTSRGITRPLCLLEVKNSLLHLAINLAIEKWSLFLQLSW